MTYTLTLHDDPTNPIDITRRQALRMLWSQCYCERTQRIVRADHRARGARSWALIKGSLLTITTGACA